MSLVNCTECGQKISARARACPACGSPKAEPENYFDPSADVSIERLDVARIGGLVGAVMIALGVFMPLVHLPIVGPTTLFWNGQGTGSVLLLLALFGFLFMLRRAQLSAVVAGGLSMATLLVFLVGFNKRMKEAAEQASESMGDSPFGQLASMPIEVTQVQYGFGFMLVGSALLVIGGFLSRSNEDLGLDVAAPDTASKAQSWITEKIAMRDSAKTSQGGSNDDHQHNAWVREQFELWIQVRAEPPPRTLTERASLFEQFKSKLERGEIDLVALRRAKQAAEQSAEKGDS